MNVFNKIKSVKGRLEFEGDKSISHRAVILSSLAGGKSFIRNLSIGEDVKSTIGCFEELGVIFKKVSGGLSVEGRGFKGLRKPERTLNCGNSGTTARLISGILACQGFESEISGDDSLSRRPMKRIIDPLRYAGALMDAREDNFLPIRFRISRNIMPRDYTMSVASAQVKSALIFTGLHPEGVSTIRESGITRNHTELMLRLPVVHEGDLKIIKVSKDCYPLAEDYFIPGDISTASFFIVLTLLARDSELIIKNVSLNSTRTGYLSILKEMGGDIRILEIKNLSGEAFGDLHIRSSSLHNVKIGKDLIPQIIDEIPILAVAGAFAEGEFRIDGGKELRVKETDRISAICNNLKQVGVRIDETEEGFCISGRVTKKSGIFESYGDHRIAMATTILSLLLENGGKINNFESIKISNPNFIKQLTKVCR
ncbi:MAG: 3-phosphoshikimate 1-carboxyvinyltransferase [Ignavibacteriaceae bacterium]|nr:3-phosphoshikimate 1-carboxyvinyltransferase [Ignavibacteriaceae bacterium]HPO55951.1 3-phosphoshikimate 1-carboxyvinyltransferase [Ignavibacteriaceae bacterium]